MLADVRCECGLELAECGESPSKEAPPPAPPHYDGEGRGIKWSSLSIAMGRGRGWGFLSRCSDPSSNIDRFRPRCNTADCSKIDPPGLPPGHPPVIPTFSCHPA